MEERQTILLVEDEKVLRQNLKNQLVAAGYQVTDAENGAIAKEMLQQNSFDLVISDLKMPELNGLQLTMFVKSELETPIVLMTAHGDLAMAGTIRDSGVDKILNKPFSKAELLGTVSELFAAAK